MKALLCKLECGFEVLTLKERRTPGEWRKSRHRGRFTRSRLSILKHSDSIQSEFWRNCSDCDCWVVALVDSAVWVAFATAGRADGSTAIAVVAGRSRTKNVVLMQYQGRPLSIDFENCFDVMRVFRIDRKCTVAILINVRNAKKLVADVAAVERN